MTEAAEVHRRIVELFCAGRRAEALALVAPDVIDHLGGAVGDQHGVTAWEQRWDQMDDGVRNGSITIEQNVSTGDFSTNRYTIRGTHIASGRSYAITGMDMVRVVDGRLVEHWALLDTAAMQHQLSVED